MNDAGRDGGGWDEACLAARLFAAWGGGAALHLRAGPGPVRDRYLAVLAACFPASAPWQRVGASVDAGGLAGGLDLPASLAARRPVAAPGLLARADGGVVVVAGAERLDASVAGLLAHALEDGAVRCERDGISAELSARFALVLLDEGDEGLPAVLAERAVFRVELDAVRHTSAPVPHPASHASLPPIGDAIRAAICEAALRLGIRSLRAPASACRVARLLATGADETGLEHAATAARLVLAHRATCMPADTAAPPEQTPADALSGDAARGEIDPGETAAVERLLAAIATSLPATLLPAAHETARSPLRAPAGRARTGLRAARRGRRVGTLAGPRPAGASLDLAATLRAAAPFGRLAPVPAAGKCGLVVRAADLRWRRYRAAPRRTTIFVVDASGSAALHRLGEAKGAVEHLLAASYVRRDRACLLAFRGTGAELLLPPTGALARARRCLAELPGGGATPLASALDAALALALALRRRGEAPVLVLLTDARANVARDGGRDRARARDDAMEGAARIAAAGVAALVVDISPRAGLEAAALARRMGAACHALPGGDAAALARLACVAAA